ncbi:MAG: hypothetical protein CMH61_03020 [Nanoarchaeota archaeon]|nr:hypothetical protein [Nanoarchaeota archaeon]|tara:strand:- start:2425 stop:4311 length:1887 start_codon:yes stop_codon:yes gene_type:complete
MNVATILLFFLYFYGFGYSFLRLFNIQQVSDPIERNLIRIGMGVPIFIVFGVLLNMLKIPLQWWIFLIPIIYAFYDFAKNNKINFPDLNFSKKNIIYIFLLVIFLLHLFMFVKGSFAYGYLEDSDPYTYARDMKYVSVEKTLDVPYFRQINFLDPYPPGYTMIMGVLHQTSPEAQWTLKFFNALLISLSLIFFFFMVRGLTRNSQIALASTFVLLMIPSYLSHFIWSHSLIPLLFFLLIYSYLRIDSNKKWWIMSAVVTAAILLTHHRQAIKLAIMGGIFFFVTWYHTKKFPRGIFLSALAGFLISLSWWAFKFKSLVRMMVGGGASDIVSQTTTGSTNFIMKLVHAFPVLFSPSGGTTTKAYTFENFIFATKYPHINTPIGWGVMISSLLLVGLIFLIWKYKHMKKSQKTWIGILLFWFLFTFLGVNSQTFNLPIGLGAFRMWMLLAIPVSILAGVGIVALNTKMKSKHLFTFLIVLLIFFTAGLQKYQFNTSDGWQYGAKWVNANEVNEFVKMRNSLPVNTKIFTFGLQNKVVIAFDMYACVWCEEYREFKKDVIKKDIDEIHSWLKKHDYKYLLISPMDLRYFVKIYGEKEGLNLMNDKLNEMIESPKFNVVYANQPHVILFQVT